MSQTPASPSGKEPASEGLDFSQVQSTPKRSGKKWIFILLILLVGLGIGTWYYFGNRSDSTAPQYRTATVARGDIVQEVTANGSLTPVKQVEVGSQVSGIIQKILVDFNSKVKKDELLARIDPSTYQKNVAQAKAQLSSAKAGLELAEVNFKRAEQLFKEKLISASDHDSAVATFHQAQATVEIQEAAVERATVDLGYTQIKAPIDGVVISRAVDEGQTVASSFNTPRLFVIANDLAQMQIEAAVSEADVGGVEEGQKVSFRVEAFQNRKFYGQVQQVRFAPVTNQNVVTYTTVVQVDNRDLKLRPGMTATASIMTAQKQNVLRIPNAAMRFRPPPAAAVQTSTSTNSAGGTAGAGAVATDSAGVPIPPWRAESRRPNPGEREKFEASLTPEQREKFQQAMQEFMRRRAEGGGGPGGTGGMGGPGAAARKPEGPTTATVYVLESGSGAAANATPSLKAVTIKAGITDGSNTEVLEGLKEGDVVATGTSLASATASAAEPPRNPFMPSFGPPRRR